MYAIIGVYFLGNKVYSDGANDIGGIAGAGEFSIVDDNIKINVIETEAQIREYLDKENNFDIVLVLSNRNTENILRYIKNG